MTSDIFCYLSSSGMEETDILLNATVTYSVYSIRSNQENYFKWPSKEWKDRLRIPAEIWIFLFVTPL
jgi:hypothetical protein